MDYAMGLVSAILTTLVFLPFFYIAYLGKQQSKKKYKIFQKEARRLGFYLDEHEHWGNTLIGLDRTRSKLIYMRILPGELFKVEIPLESIEKCNVLIERNRRKTNGNVSFDLVRVDLELIHTKPAEKSTLLNLYDRDGQVSQDFEVERAEKWKKLIEKNCNLPGSFRSAS
ncbi:hypothetical protein [Muriicola marianensis]|uniref:Uncharacterized protein n=1 Tax=Muriicola marianensis TaxID=1324801 RepID=A0ABQ1R4N1_9FLAO|nr:hypothetical protein [Muriicola marianensis]GGD58008.1 hypothetical protein GCM10011361_25590 [Muriicola marianensis]